MAKACKKIPEDIRDFLSYDPETGLFVWIKKYHRSIKVGKIAGHINYEGYVDITFRGENLKAHRLANYFMLGYDIPDGFVMDHANHNTSDNRWVNLECKIKKDNDKNKSRASNNTSGVTGVSLDKGRWKASIKMHGKYYHLGRFDTIDEAKEARILAQNKLGFHKNHGKDI